MKLETLVYKKENRVGRVTLSRPEALNAISPQLLEDLERVMDEAAGDPEVKALVITGEGRAFSAGADLKHVLGFFDSPAAFAEYLKNFNRVILKLEELPVVTLALVNGFAFAGGLELLLACDLAIAAEDATIGDQHINFALCGGPVHIQLPRRIGTQRALEHNLTGGWVTGRQAEAMGLVLRAVPRDKLEEEGEKLLAQLRDKSREAFAPIKRAVKRGVTMGLAEGFEYSGLQTLQYFNTSDNPRRGVQAFVEKKGPPKF